MNSTYAAGSGHAKEELIGRNHFDLFPDAENQAIFERVRDTGEPTEFRAKPYEFTDQPWRGVTYWDWRLTPVKEADGSLHGLAFSLQDVTRTVREQLFGEAINRLNDVIHANLDFDSVLSEFAPQMASAVGCEAVAIALRRTDGTWRFREVLGAQESDVMQRVFGDDDFPLAVQAFEAGRPLVLTVDSETRSLARLLGFKSALVAPLSALNRPLGTIACGFTSGPGTFDEAQVDFVAKIASSLSLALQNAQLYAAEHRIADRLQEALLSLPAEIAGVDFAFDYHSAAEAARVGGDFYDVFPLGGDRLGVTIGDVAGKGIDAAVLTSFAKNTIRAYAAEKDNSPSEVLTLTNALLYETTPPESFVSVFFGVLDKWSDRLEWANAGHTSAVLMRGGGSTDLLASTGTILGAFPHVEVEQRDALVSCGDVLFLYTDGLIEARDGKAMYGEEGLLRFLAKAKWDSLSRLVEAAVDDVVAFTKTGLSDDVAVLALSRNDEGGC